MPKKSKSNSSWPKAPTREAERQESNRKLRAARALVAPLLKEEKSKDKGV